MKLVRHGTQVVAIIEQGWEKAYLLSQHVNFEILWLMRKLADLVTDLLTKRMPSA